MRARHRGSGRSQLAATPIRWKGARHGGHGGRCDGREAEGVRACAGCTGFPATRSTASPTRCAGTAAIAWQHVRHEEAAAFAAAAEAALTGELAVCAGSCGPGNLHLINGLFDANRSRVPVLAIAAQIPRDEIGCELLPGDPPAGAVPRVQRVHANSSASPSQLPRVLEIAMRTALAARRGRRDRRARARCSSPTRRPTPSRCRSAPCRADGPARRRRARRRRRRC